MQADHVFNEPIPAFLAKVFSLIEKPGSSDIMCWYEGQHILIKNSTKLEKVLLPKMFTILPVAKFLEKMKNYGYIQNNTAPNGEIILRFTLKGQEQSQKKKMPVIQAAQTTAQKKQERVKELKSKYKADMAEPKTNEIRRELNPTESEELITKVKEKIQQIQAELTKLSQSHPDKKAEISKIMSFTCMMLEHQEKYRLAEQGA